jgi:hypothetical protein
VFGLGLGLFMQVLTLVVQNAVPMKQMGVATSSVTFFRSMGGAIGASALGAVLTAGIAAEFPRFLPPAALAGGGKGGNKVAQLIQSPAVLDALKRTDPALHEGIIQAYSHAIDRLFIAAVPVSVLSVIAALFIRQVKLRTSNTQARPAGDSVAAGAVASGPATAGSATAAESATAAGPATSAAPASETGAVPPAPEGML